MHSPLIKSLLLGAAPGGAAVALSFVIRYYLGGVFLPELASQTLIALVPGQLESSAVENLGSLAKYTTFAAAIALNVVLYGGLAVISNRLHSRFSGVGYLSLALRSGVLSYGFFLAIGLVLSALGGSVSQSVPLGLVALSFIPPNFLFGITFPYLVPKVALSKQDCVPAPTKRRPFDRRRRLFIKAGTAAAVATAILIYGLDVLFTRIGVGSTTTSDAAQISSSQVTPNEKFYRVDINIIPPGVDPKAWSLESTVWSTPRSPCPTTSCWPCQRSSSTTRSSA
jgi:hypothetical protein